MPVPYRWIKPLRLILAFLLAPAIMLLWWSVSFDAVMWYYDMGPDGPALIMLGMLLLGPVLLTLLLGFGLCVFLVLAEDRLNLRLFLLPTISLGLLSGLSVYLSARPWGAPFFAPAYTALSVLGVIMTALCFYFVGVWKTVPRRREDPPPRADTPDAFSGV